MSLASIAAYRRTVHASLARVRENVLDWEHLPWLHRETFGHVRLIACGTDGWRAETSLRGASPGDVFLLDVAFERDGLTYHSRTIAGRGAGTDIVTRLEPLDDDTTRVVVEFLVADVPPAHRDALGAAYVRLYTRLWDQDEAMTRRRQAVLDGRVADDVREVVVGDMRLRHATTCPHRGGPLDDAAVEDGCVRCPWHGYRFDLGTGRCVDGSPLRLAVGPARPGR
jgi:hypothetical protein